MNHIFTIKTGNRVPDGTIVHPFLNPQDSDSGLPFQLPEGFSIAAGEIAPRSQSKIHVMPLITQVTFVLSGQLDVIMRDQTTPDQYRLHLIPEQAAVTTPGTFLQLINAGAVTCRVLYLVNPGYVFLRENDQIIYDDALVFNEDWQMLAQVNWRPPSLVKHKITPEARAAALKRIKERVLPADQDQAHRDG